MSDALTLGGTIATGLLIGREPQLDNLRAACLAEGDDFRCALVRAVGGIGKTRLLQEVVERLGGPADPCSSGATRGVWASDHVVALPLVDVADPDLHTAVLFLRAVCNHLRSLHQLPDQEGFAQLMELIDDYVQARAFELPAPRLYELQTAITDLFFEIYAQLTEKVRVVWVIDTMEQLITTRAEVEALSREAGIAETLDQLGTYRWLIEFVSRLPDNTTLLLAGRPVPPRWADDISATIDLHRALLKPADPEQLVRPQVDDKTPTDRRAAFQIRSENIGDENARAAMAILVEPLNFTQAEIQTYLEALHTRLLELAEQNQSYQLLAAYLRRNLLDDAEQMAILRVLTDGNPIRLAIYVELLLNNENNPLQLFESEEELEALSEGELADLNRKINSTLLEHLNNHLDNQTTQVVKLLAMMRRGLDPERLKMLWGGEKEDSRQILQRLRRYSFVKVRGPAAQSPEAEDAFNERIFLHDEFYTIYQTGLIAIADDQLAIQRAEQRKFFGQLADFCSASFRMRMDRVLELEPRLLAADGTRAAERRDPNRQEYTRLKIEQRQLRNEELHYELYHHPLNAFFDLYARRAEQALSANAFEYEAQYRSEIDLFFFGSTQENNRVLTGVDATTWGLLRMGVVYEQVSSWVRRLISSGRLAEAQHLAEQAIQNFPRLAGDEHPWLAEVRASEAGQELEQLYEQKLRAYGAFAAIFSGKDTSGAIGRLMEVARQLRRRLEPEVNHLPEACQTHFQNLLAQVLLYIGYAYVGLNQFQKARTYYQEGAAIVERTGFRTLKAELRNNLSRVLGELGDTNRALRYCQEALNLRKALGFRYLAALSTNTMALIYIRDDRSHPEGIIWADQALARFRQLEQPRGIGLALIQKAEALRRQVNMQVATRLAAAGPPLNLTAAERDSMRDELAKAEQALDEADGIFKRQSPETVRQIEVEISRASLYRDWALLLQDGSDDKARGLYIEAALQTLGQVFAICGQSSTTSEDYALYELNALIVRAMVYQQLGDIASAEHDLAQAQLLIPDEYQLLPGRPFRPGKDVREIFFRELSRIAYVRTKLVPADASDLDVQKLEQYALAVQYMQLFTPYRPVLVERTAHNLSDFLSKVKTVSRSQSNAINQALRGFHERYQIEQLREYLGTRARDFALPPSDEPVIAEFIDS